MSINIVHLFITLSMLLLRLRTLLLNNPFNFCRLLTETTSASSPVFPSDFLFFSLLSLMEPGTDEGSLCSAISEAGLLIIDGGDADAEDLIGSVDGRGLISLISLALLLKLSSVFLGLR